MSLKDIELTLRDQAPFGRSAHQRRAQIPSYTLTLGQSLKKSAQFPWRGGIDFPVPNSCFWHDF